MRLNALRTFLLAACLALAVGVAACGGDDNEGKTTGGKTTAGTPAQGKKGGKITLLATDDVDFIDPGQTYYSYAWMIMYAMHRPLYSFKPDNAKDPIPDLAEAAPEISDDAKTVTVKIRSGVKFSPPVNREVTSKDVKYAIERGFFKTVANGYAGAYYGNIEGAKTGVKAGTTISGITTPDDNTIVFKLSKPTGGVLAGALALPLSAPVPEEFAAKYDKKNPSKYGEHQVNTGPYMLKTYQAAKLIELVRNPNWDGKATGDYRPAYIDEYTIPSGNDDTTVASRKIRTGQSLMAADFSPPPAELKVFTTRAKDQIAFVSAGGGRYVAMNTKIKPFDDINVRKAVVAGFDRKALLLARGGSTVGDIPTHIMPPGVPGFEEDGGMEGPGLDFLAKPEGDPALSAEYFKKAGFASGKYEGKDEILMVGTSEGIAQKVAEVSKENFEKLGFKVRLRLVTQDAMYTRFCNVPRAKVAVCPNVGWFKDFSDGQTILDPTFNGKNILPENNSNWSQLDVPEINKKMAEGAELTDPAERAQAWGEIDKLVTEQAPVIPYIWDKEPQIWSANVNGVPDEFLSQPNLSFSSLK